MKRTTYEFYYCFFFSVTAAMTVITKRHDIKIHLKVYFNLSVKWLECRLIPHHICFLFYLYPLQAKKARSHLELSENKRAWERSLESGQCQGWGYILFGLETVGKKKENLKTTTKAKPKSAPCSDEYFIGEASLSHRL